ncbi:hypothetical protein NA78x_003020 [Anatilimnocola sp. NA78]|uniref:hypothetical protein n=1 Tax=Anatilimnocola sp. NA78 TaxID=3415683 RepID=UPI003CE4D3BD
MKEHRLITDKDEAVLADNTSEWLAYALICWECQVLDEPTRQTVKRIVDEEIDLADWDEQAPARKKSLAKFLKKISTPAKKAKSIPRFFTCKVPYQAGDCIAFSYPTGDYGGAICFGVDTAGKKPEWYSYLIGITRLRQSEKPTTADFYRSHLLVFNYGRTIEGLPAKYIEAPVLQVAHHSLGPIRTIEQLRKRQAEFERAEVVGQLTVRDCLNSDAYSLSFNLGAYCESQFAWEAAHPESIDQSYPIQRFFEL